MAISVTIQVNGTADEVRDALQRLGLSRAALLDGGATADGAITPELADRIVRGVKPDARRVLRFIAENAPEVSWDAVQQHMKMSGVRIGGVMASFGFAEKRGLPRPYVNDPEQRVYKISPKTASSMLDAIRRLEKK